MIVTNIALDEVPSRDLEKCCGDRFFTSRIFADLWTAKGGRPVAWVLQDAGRTAAVLPGVEFGRAFYRRFMSMPDGCYGGVLVHPDWNGAKDGPARTLLDAVLGAGYARTFLFDFDGDLPDDPRLEPIPLQTTLVDISSPGWLPPDKKLQSQIRKAEREGIVVQTMDWERYGRRFMDLMLSTEQRHGCKPCFPRPFFEKLADAAERDERVHWVWCEHEGQGVCSHIYVIERGVLQGWQIYFDKRFSFLKPNQYIRYSVCRRMADRGVRFLNLGGTPENAPGLEYYKRRWGGETVKYRGLAHRRGLGRLGAFPGH